VRNNQRLIDELAAWMEAPDPNTVWTNGHARPVQRSYQGPTSFATDEEVIEKCRAAKNAAKFADLFDHGDTNAHNDGDDSAADLGLLSMLAFWTQDPAQLERIFSSSALGRREKWRHRGDYRERTIRKALADIGETYGWRESYRYRTPIRGSNGKDGQGQDRERTASISFADIPEPEKPEDVWEGVIVRGWPALFYSGTGVTKSVTALAAAQAIADENTQVFLGRDVITAPVMYADWELNEAVQGRRAYHIARGRGRLAPPSGLRYMSTYGTARRHRQAFAQDVLAECINHKVEVCFIDSVGLAVGGNPGDFEVIVAFYEEVVADFTANGITPVLIDHQRRLMSGERNQSLGAYGSVQKENLARTQLQIELVSRDREAHTVTMRLRTKKRISTNSPNPSKSRPRSPRTPSS